MGSAAARAKHRHQRLIGFAAYRAVSLNARILTAAGSPYSPSVPGRLVVPVGPVPQPGLALQATPWTPCAPWGPAGPCGPGSPFGPGSLPQPASASAMLTASTGKILTRSPYVGVRPLLVATFHHYAFNRGTALGVQIMSESRMARKTRRREPAGLRELNQKQWVAGSGCSMAALLSCRVGRCRARPKVTVGPSLPAPAFTGLVIRR